MKNEDKKLSLILSTGRTGTNFYEYFINNYSKDAFCMHEPKPSRRFKIIGNLPPIFAQIRENGVNNFLKTRKHYFEKYDNYIESNNFLFALAEDIASMTERKVSVLHIFRDPQSYVYSHLQHGFWLGRKKFAAIMLPYWLENWPIAISEMRHPVEILLKRWYFVNKKILEYEHSNNILYLRVPFENLFEFDGQNFRRSLKFLNVGQIFFNENAMAKKNLGVYSYKKFGINWNDYSGSLNDCYSLYDLMNKNY
jgi:hypothetical protein